MAIRRAGLFALALLSMGLGACATGFNATYDNDPGHDFSGYQTFAWISDNPMIVGPTDRMVNPLVEPRIMSAIEDGMAVRGYKKIDDADAADFVISFTIGSREEIKVSSYPSTYAAYGYGRGWGGRYYGVGMATETQVRQYQQGMLAVDIFDVKERRPVWHGVATKSITESDRKNLNETIEAAVTAILKAFPPPQ